MAHILIKTFGCSLNQSDSEVMAGILTDAGHSVDSIFSSSYSSLDILNKYDIVIINTCTVKNLAERKFLKEFEHWQKKGTKIIVAGCIPQAAPEMLKDILSDVSVIGTRQIINIKDIVDQTLKGHIIHNVSNDYNERLNLPKIRKSSLIEILPISEGCLSGCSFCKTKYARGDLLSYPKEKIIKQFKEAVSDGCKEIWLTSQDNGCYGFDIYRKEKYFLNNLLDDLLSIEGDFMIRVGMANPDHIKRIDEALIQSFKHPKIFKFLHIPIQSGSNKVLKLMRRNYTVSDYENIVSKFRKEIPQITISTDIILGFPGETDELFDESMEMVKRTKPDVLNISRFWLRKGTPAEKMEQIPGGTSKIRSEKIKKLFDSILRKKNKDFIGQTCDILINEIGRAEQIIGRPENYKQVIIDTKNANNKNKKISLGQWIQVKIVDSSTYDLRADVLKIYKRRNI